MRERRNRPNRASIASGICIALCAGLLTGCSLVFSADAAGDSGVIVPQDAVAEADSVPVDAGPEADADGFAPLEATILAGDDDAVLLPGANVEFNNPDDLDLGVSKEELATRPTTVALRFASVNIPKNQELQDARVQFTAQENQGAPTFLEIVVERGQGAGLAFVSANSLAERALAMRMQAIDWTIDEPWSVGDSTPAQRSVSVSVQLEDLVSSEHWEPGNGVVIFIYNGEIPAGDANTQSRPVHSFESSMILGEPSAPRLLVR